MTELATTAPAGFSLVPASFHEAKEVADYLSKSDLVPKDYQGKPSNIVVAMAWGSEVGLKPLQALQNIAVINGRGSIWGDAALALCMSRPEFEDIEERIEGEGDARVAICTVKRKGRTPVTRKFSVEDAKKSGLWQTQAKVERRGQNGSTYMKDNDSPWYRFPERMLQMRARGFALRDSFPDAMRGLYLAEELQGDLPEKDITPLASRPAVVMPTATATAAPAAAGEPVDADFVDPDTGEIIPGNEPEQPAEPVTQVAEGEATVSDGQLRVLRARLKAANIDESVLAEAMGLPSVAAIPASKCNHALDWIKKYSA